MMIKGFAIFMESFLQMLLHLKVICNVIFSDFNTLHLKRYCILNLFVCLPIMNVIPSPWLLHKACSYIRDLDHYAQGLCIYSKQTSLLKHKGCLLLQLLHKAKFCTILRNKALCRALLYAQGLKFNVVFIEVVDAQAFEKLRNELQLLHDTNQVRLHCQNKPCGQANMLIQFPT